MIWQDLRLAFRTLIKRPGFAAVAISTLALGIGANSAVFSLVEGVLLRPLPFKQPDRLVMVWEKNLKRDRARNVVNPGNYFAWRDRNHVFEDIAAFVASNANLTGQGEPIRVDVGYATANIFGVLGVPPILGRAFESKDAQSGAAPVMLLSERSWRNRFGADPAMLGRTLDLNGRPTTVVGIAPASFQVPPGAELWVPIPEDARASDGRSLATIARLKPGVGVEAARSEMATIAAQLAAEEKDKNAGWSASVFPLHADLVRDARPALLALFGAVAMVLLIACCNLANLLLARALGRSREMAIRRALGASQSRIVGQLLVESLLLAGLGGAAGIVVASWLMQALLSVVPSEVRSVFVVGIDVEVLGFTLGVCVASALLFGLAPAWQAARSALVPSLREGSSGSGSGRERRRISRTLVAIEVALSLVLLVGAGLLLRSFERLSRVDPGFDPRNVLSLQVSLPRARYANPVEQQRFYAAAVERLSQLPGVTAAGGISWRPLGVGSATRFTLPDRVAPAAGDEPTADVRFVTPGLFPALGVRLLRGRDFAASDTAERSAVVIVGETTARTYWPGQDPIGRRVNMGWGKLLDAEVVGVVADVRLTSLDTEPRPALWWPVSQVSNDFMTFLIRTGEDSPALPAAAKTQLAGIDPNLPVARIEKLDDVVSASLQRPRFTFALIGAFAATAMLLAAIGLFGVLSYAVGQRTRELGVRLALGAQPRDLVRLLLGEGLWVAATGLAAGIGIAAAGSRLLQTLLFQTSPLDPVAFGSTAALLLAVSALASLVPALRAGRVDPARALHAE